MIFRVTRTTYDGNISIFDFEELQKAKDVLDIFYKHSEDAGDVAVITAIQHEEIVEYESPWKNPQFVQAMQLSHEELAILYIELQNHVQSQ